MTLQAYPVTLESGVIRSVDGSSLSDRANAVLVVLPGPSEAISLEEWQKPFDAYFAAVENHRPEADPGELSDNELNAFVHTLRRAA